METSVAIRDRIEKFILDNFVPDGRLDEVDDEASLSGTRIVDSIGVLEVLIFLEDEFGIEMEANEVTPDNLDSIARICSYLERKGVTSVRP